MHSRIHTFKINDLIQRIQSIFLLLAAAAAFTLFAFPFANSNKMVEGSSLMNDGLYSIQDHVGLLALFSIAGGLAFVSIFLFKNRKNQLLVARLALVANIIGLVLAVLLFMQDKVFAASDAAVDDGMGLYLPILFTIFAFLAQHFINKDEKLVKSMDRLR